MPQITTIRVVRRRSVQPEQFGNAAAEVELTGNVLEGEDYKAVARQMLRDSRALVYENLGMKLPASAVADAEEVDTPEETATVETKTEEKPKESKKRGPGRPKGSKDTAPRKNAKSDDDDLPSDDDGKEDEPQIRKNPEDRKNPDDDDDGIPGDDDGDTSAEETKADDGDADFDLGDEAEAEESDGGEADLTSEDLHKHINDSIKAGKLTVMQAKQMQQEMKVARVRDLDTPAKVKKAKTMIDSFIKQNEAK